MIRLTCTSCKNALEIDDAFAGGVCRCNRCGTIQTVPAKGASARTAAAGQGSKTLFENKARSAGVVGGSGLEDLADIVASSSGLSDTRLRKKPPLPPPQPSNNHASLLLGAAAIVILLLVIIVLVLVFRGLNPKVSPSDSNVAPAPAAALVSPAPSPPAPPPVTGPNFCGTPIDQGVVVYLIDNGFSSDLVLDSIKSAVFKSIESLGPNRRFQILWWNPDTPTYPTGNQTSFAEKDNIDLAHKKLDDVVAAGSTDPIKALKNALSDNPGQIVLITAKAADLDDSLVDQVMAIRGSSKVKIDCISINGVTGDSALAKIASQTSGKFVVLPEAQLKAFAY
jgi:hypothetical protein